MTLIERMAKQGAVPFETCNNKEFCNVNVRRYCKAMKVWRDFRYQAYKQHIAWCVKMLSFKE